MNNIDKNREILQLAFNELIKNIGPINIGSAKHFPYGWRKAAKGRTVWRILEEIITQNIEYHAKLLGFIKVEPSLSEVGIYDVKVKLPNDPDFLYINIKSCVKGGRINKDDISKAVGLINFFGEDKTRQLYIVTFSIEFISDMTILLDAVYVMPINWIPDIYVNPSNNGNLQSSKYKNIGLATRRSIKEFVNLLIEESNRALGKRMSKLKLSG